MFLLKAYLIFILLLSSKFIEISCQCGKASVTTVKGSKAPSGKICPGQLIFEDTFDALDNTKWKYENTMAGGGNNEFQWYVGYNSSNTYVQDGNLHIKTTLTDDVMGDNFVSTGHITIPANECTASWNNGCDRQGSETYILPPVRSTRMHTISTFGFKYGILEIRAKMPVGDWLWPALWLMPYSNVYGQWPRSGEIDLAELRGNRNIMNWGTNVGINQTASTLHFGPSASCNGFMKAHYEKNSAVGYNEGFNTFRVEWTQTNFKFYINGVLYGTVNPTNGFWDLGNLSACAGGATNPWTNKMAPFDQEFFIIMNLAIGGTNYFSDSWTYSPFAKPWLNTSPNPMTLFWSKKSDWYSTWNPTTDDNHLQIDYVRVWAL